MTGFSSSVAGVSGSSSSPAGVMVAGTGVKVESGFSIENPDSTFTPVPATITPAGLELDPDTPATLDENPVNETAKP